MFDYLDQIRRAAVYDVAIKTPLEPATIMTRRLGNEVWLKREDLQPVFSFKCRGAYNKLASLSEAERATGVIAASAGNHAQGVALAAKQLGIDATIVMPCTTPDIKVDAVRQHGAHVVLHGDAYDDAARHAQALVDERGMVYVHPYDDPYVIAGQGTVGMEIIEQAERHVDAIYVPVGGGGLLAGVLAYVKAVSPTTRVYAVEAEDSACLALAMREKRRAILPHVGIFADGVAVAQIGKETFRVIEPLVDGVITVNTDEICAGIKEIFTDTRSIAEPAGALALAGLKKHVEQEGLKNQLLVAINSGANTNFDRLRYISERTEIGEKREAVLAVTIPERPGSFRRFCELLGRRSITEFNYRFHDDREAHIYVGLQVEPGSDDKQHVLKTLQQNDYPIVDMTDNEMAKLHIRHMVGGHASAVSHERLFRFQFPERPGALLQFLTRLGERWNISLFHYRNHGSAFGRVLVGLQVPEQDGDELLALLSSIDYTYAEETDNPAYRAFLL